MVVCILLLSLSGDSRINKTVIVNGKEEDKISAFWPIFIAVLAAFYFMSRLLFNKVMSIKFKWKAYDVVCRSQIL